MLDFAWLAPEINSERIFTGAGPAPLFAAATAWEGLSADLQATAAAIQSVLTDLTSGPWTGAASAAMAASVSPYVPWMTAAAAHATFSAAQAQLAAMAFETAMTATVHPAVIAANRTLSLALIATNFLGQNTPAIESTECEYMEMWAQDVAAMSGYHGEAMSLSAALTPFDAPPVNLEGAAASASAPPAPAPAAVPPPGMSSLARGVSGAPTMASEMGVSQLMSAAQAALGPIGTVMGPLMQLGQTAKPNATGLVGAAVEGIAADLPKSPFATATAVKGLSGEAMGRGISASLGQSRLVGAMSVPPTWPGSSPVGMASSALHGLGAISNPTVLTEEPVAAAGTTPMTPMPPGLGGLGGGMPGAMTSRGAATPTAAQRPHSVVPHIGVG
ncbi:PPE family protein [Mycobacterium montefiorense]|uniref:PPE family protein n=1 Tax=Mycobacterium montefiorense TaxID=154654 RepID=UPI0021F3BB31|nr:PPE family protein [Mycobacterium montefiorense]MCV7425402.1 PPE family protein [Mycobacterium montefiorense]